MNLDNLRCDYMAEITLQFELRAEIREHEESGVTVGTAKLQRRLKNSIERAQAMDKDIQKTLCPHLYL